MAVVTPVVYRNRLGKILLVGSAQTMTNTYPVKGSIIYPLSANGIIAIESNGIPPELPLKFLAQLTMNVVNGGQLELIASVYNSSQVLLSQKNYKYPIGGAYGSGMTGYGSRMTGDNEAEGCVQVGPVTGAFYVGLEVAFRSFEPFVVDTIVIAAGYHTNY